jgi:ABC-type branched-subunit amino acid transport system ATPase component
VARSILESLSVRLNLIPQEIADLERENAELQSRLDTQLELNQNMSTTCSILGSELSGATPQVRMIAEANIILVPEQNI